MSKCKKCDSENVTGGPRARFIGEGQSVQYIGEYEVESYRCQERECGYSWKEGGAGIVDNISGMAHML